MSDNFKGQSPWGAPPGGGSNGNGSGRGPRPPNIDELINDLQEKIKKYLKHPEFLKKFILQFIVSILSLVNPGGGSGMMQSTAQVLAPKA